LCECVGKNAINRWRLAEWNVLNQICKAHSVEISEPKKSKGFDFTSEEYKTYQDEIHALENAKDKAESELLDTQDELKRASEKKSKLTKIDSIETKKSVFGNKVSLLQEDYDELSKYKKPATISRNVLKKQAKEISEKEQLKVKLRKAMAFINAYGLSNEFFRFKFNKTRDTELE
jgi:hypothetical protein